MPLYGRNGHLLGDGSRLLGWCPGLAVGWADIRFTTKDSGNSCIAEFVESPPFPSVFEADERQECQNSLASWNKPFSLRLRVTGGDWWTFSFTAPFNSTLFDEKIPQYSKSEFDRISGGSRQIVIDVNGGSAIYSKPIWNFAKCSKIKVAFDRIQTDRGRLRKNVRNSWIRAGEDGDEYGCYGYLTYRSPMIQLDARVEFYCANQWFYWSPYVSTSNFGISVLDASPNVVSSAGGSDKDPVDGREYGVDALVCT